MFDDDMFYASSSDFDSDFGSTSLFDDSPFEDTSSVNPASGLPMMGLFDVAGNLWGSITSITGVSFGWSLFDEW
jgi:hypothetical protein